MFDHDTSIRSMDFEATVPRPCSVLRDEDPILFMEFSAFRPRPDRNFVDVGVRARDSVRSVDRADVQRAPFADLAGADAEIRKTVLANQRESPFRAHEHVGARNEHRRLRIF